MTATLYERLGGEAGIAAIANDVVDNHLANPLVQARFSAAKDIPKLKRLATELSPGDEGELLASLVLRRVFCGTAMSRMPRELSPAGGRLETGSRTGVDALFVGYERQENLGLRSIVAYLSSRGRQAVIVPFVPADDEHILSADGQNQPGRVE